MEEKIQQLEEKIQQQQEKIYQLTERLVKVENNQDNKQLDPLEKHYQEKLQWKLNARHKKTIAGVCDLYNQEEEILGEIKHYKKISRSIPTDPSIQSISQMSRSENRSLWRRPQQKCTRVHRTTCNHSQHHSLLDRHPWGNKHVDQNAWQ